MDINILNGLIFSFFAGLSTSIEAAFAFIAGSRGGKFLSFCLGLSAGVMLYVSFMEIMQYSIANSGKWVALFAFFGGLFQFQILINLYQRHKITILREKKKV